VLNYTDALGGDSGTYFFISRMDSASGLQEWGKLNKRACAQRIMNAVKVGHSSEA
jgi:hypothetical protein